MAEDFTSNQRQLNMTAESGWLSQRERKFDLTEQGLRLHMVFASIKDGALRESIVTLVTQKAKSAEDAQRGKL
jgi:ADP-dependent phosphofructokinase/glucokinase